jgi:hypothetical protein
MTVPSDGGNCWPHSAGGGGVAARGERVIGHQGDMFWRAHLKLARQMAGERS